MKIKTIPQIIPEHTHQPLDAEEDPSLHTQLCDVNIPLEMAKEKWILCGIVVSILVKVVFSCSKRK